MFYPSPIFPTHFQYFSPYITICIKKDKCKNGSCWTLIVLLTKKLVNQSITSSQFILFLV